jgi:hypothetical protein
VPLYELELELAQTALRRAALLLEHDVEPAAMLEEVAGAVARALGAVFDAFDGRGDRLFGVHGAMTEIDRAAGAASGGAPRGFEAVTIELGRARAELVRAEARLASILPQPPVPAPDLLVSIDVPRLHLLERPSLTPRIVVPRPAPQPPAVSREPVPRPTSFEELTALAAAARARALVAASAAVAGPPKRAEKATAPAAVPAGFARDVGVAMDEPSFQRARARECFEEVAMVAMQRLPLPGDDWRSCLGLERRMLAAIDLIAGIGPIAIAHVPVLYADSPVKDPSRAFAVGMVLGTMAGRDALAAAEHAVLGGDPDAASIRELGAALELVPSPHLPLALRSLLRDPAARIRAMAIDVLGYRGMATTDELASAAMDEPAVAAVALEHLACAPNPALPALLDIARRAADPALRAAALAATALASPPHAMQHLAEGIRDETLEGAAVLLAIAGDEHDAAHLLARAVAAPGAALVTAVGWAGAANAIPTLIGFLDHTDGAVREAAACALDRITAAGLWEQVEMADEEIAVPEPPEPPVAEPSAPKLAQVISDPRHPPPQPQPELMARPSTDPARWRAWWQQTGASYDVQARYRRGKPFTPAISLDELDGGSCTPAERRLLQRELMIRTGGFVRFDPHDLVRVQETALEAWRPIASRASSAPGRWARPYRRQS